MSAAASAPTRPAPTPVHTLASEWRKLRALRANPVGAAVILAVGVGVGVFITAVGDGSALAEARADGEYAVLFYGSGLTTWAFVYLAAGFIAVEFGGVGRSTFVATARRTRVLAAKAVLIASCGLAVGGAASALAVAAIQGVLLLRGFPPLDLADPGLVRAAAVMVPASMVVQGLLAAGIAVLVRSAAGAVVITGLISLLPVSGAPFFGAWYSAHVPRWLPGAAVESLAGVAAPGSYGHLPWPAALACVAGWLAVLGAVAALRLPRTDIG